MQYNSTLVTVLFGMRSQHQENALLMIVEISKVLFTNTLTSLCDSFFFNCDMPLLINSAGVID